MVEKKSDDIQYFNRRSLTYENSLKQWFFFDRIQKAVLNIVEKEYTPEVVLDAGCGTGRLLRKVRKRCPAAQLIGVDAAAGMIENASKLMPYAKFYVSRAESLTLPDASVDLVFSTASFHHWQDKEKALSEIKRVSRLGVGSSSQIFGHHLGCQGSAVTFNRTTPLESEKLLPMLDCRFKIREGNWDYGYS